MHPSIRPLDFCVTSGEPFLRLFSTECRCRHELTTASAGAMSAGILFIDAR
jgi:hypothetical protein